MDIKIKELAKLLASEWFNEHISNKDPREVFESELIEDQGMRVEPKMTAMYKQILESKEEYYEQVINSYITD